jgi:hypothetical protein
MAAKRDMETKRGSNPLDTFLGVTWKSRGAGERGYRKWRLTDWYDDGTWVVTLCWDIGPNPQSQIEVTGYGDTLKAALRDLEKQLSRVVGLMQP